MNDKNDAVKKLKEVSKEIQVALYLVGDTIDDTVLNRLLQVEPVVSIKKGDQRVQKSTGQTFGFYSESTWGFSSAQAVRSSAIEDHTEWLCSKVSVATDKLRSNAEYKAWIEVTSTTEPDSNHFVLPSRLVALADDLSATVGVVCLDPDEPCESDLILSPDTHSLHGHSEEVGVTAA